MQSISFDEIKAEALKLGWDDVGITPAKIPTEDIAAYEEWVQSGHQAKLTYMENALRCDPQALFPGAKTAIIFVSNYKQQKQPLLDDSKLVASYARGRDYHHVHRKRLKKFILWLEQRAGQQGIAKGFSDSSPILEKALAVQAGLGWFGKNTLLIHRRFGTFTLLAGLLTSLEFSCAITQPRLPRCGSCQKCMDACPTQALVSPYKLDANRCLSYHLIESKEPLPDHIRNRNPGYAFGCDICQDACPHNVRSPLSLLEDFSPERGMGAYLTLETLKDLQDHPERLHGTPLQRRGVKGLQHTLESTSVPMPVPVPEKLK